MYSSEFVWEKKVELIAKPIVAANSKPIQGDIGVNNKPVKKEESEFDDAVKTFLNILLIGGLFFLFFYFLAVLGLL